MSNLGELVRPQSPETLTNSEVKIAAHGLKHSCPATWVGPTIGKDLNEDDSLQSPIPSSQPQFFSLSLESQGWCSDLEMGSKDAPKASSKPGYDCAMGS